MTSQIAQRQNEQLQLKRLVAQRRLYSRAKAVLAWQMIVTVAFVVLWSLVVLWVPALKAYAAVWGMIAVALDFALFVPWQTALKRKAAGIQELFDCDVLELPWQEIKAGAPPDMETITEWSCLPQGADYASMKVLDWYPAEAGNAPMHVGRLISQRANCWWDAKLRRRCGLWAAVGTAAMFLFAVIVSLIGRASLEQFLLAGLMPFLTVFVVGIRQLSEQYQAATRLDDLRRHSERLWKEALAGQIPEAELIRRCRTLQDEIFEQRRRNPLIFDWVYQLLRNKQEELMNKCAAELLREARAALGF